MSNQSVTSSETSSSSSIPVSKTILMASYNMKGGVAKTTSTLEFGYLLSKAGLKVLLVDADMQANLTTKFIYASCISECDPELVNEESEQVQEEVELAYDEMWKLIRVDEVVTGGDLRTFDHILQVFTRPNPEFKRKNLDRIKPFEASTPTHQANNQVLHLIAGHLRTGDYDDSIRRGYNFSSDQRQSVVGLVTNVIREFAEKNHYDIVIFDLGPYLSPVAQSVLLGVDYIFSPFRCERDCVTAATIVPRKLRDWHKSLKDDNKTLNERCLYDPFEAWFASHMKTHEDLEEIVSPRLACFPVLLGAFPVSVAMIYQQPTSASRHYIEQVRLAYEKPIQEYNRLFSKKNSNGEDDNNRKRGFKFIFTAMDPQPLWIENSYTVGMLATEQKDSIPCVSWYADSFEQQRVESFEKLSLPEKIRKAKKIAAQYGNIFLKLLEGMTPEDKEYLESKINRALLLPPITEKSTPGSKRKNNSSVHLIEENESDVPTKKGRVSPQKRTNGLSAGLYDTAEKCDKNQGCMALDRLNASTLKLETTGRNLSEGDSFYEAIKICTNGQDTDYLREQVHQRLTEHSEDYLPFIDESADKTLEDYANDVLQRSLANDFEIRAMSDVLERPILVIRVDGTIFRREELERFPDAEPIFVYYNRRKRYDGLVLRGKKTASEALAHYDALAASNKTR